MILVRRGSAKGVIALTLTPTDHTSQAGEGGCPIQISGARMEKPWRRCSYCFPARTTNSSELVTEKKVAEVMTYTLQDLPI